MDLANMADGVNIEELNMTYEELADLEREFEDVETEIIRQQETLLKPLYAKREKAVAKIPNFWPLVFEQAPPDVDQYVQPSDSAVILSSLKSVSVSHFEIENGGKGDPRSLCIKLEFDENEYFENKVLEKKFWYRRSKDGDASLVSEPVAIKWKEGKDLTEGMLDLAIKVWENDKKQPKSNGDSKNKIKKPADYTADEKALLEKIEAAGLGGVSFFAFFGYRGEDISEEESRLANEEDKKKRAQRAAGDAPELVAAEEDEDDDEEDDDEDDPLALEIFPDGDELAIAIGEDLWPNALKYFTQAMDADAISDVEFEDDEDDEMDDANDDDEVVPAAEGKPESPSKKRKH
ncbi:nucleosome assembly protein [Xylariomycetidae sp. FL2044]|nr:nucleosome assembly protein [Xylariomycetidae sp. FL2044]